MAGPQSKQDPRHKGEIPSETLVFREFAGMNVASPRESIRDDQFAWLENFMPIAPGNLPVVNIQQAKGVTYASAVVLEFVASIGGVDYIFTFLADGSAYKVNGSTFVSTSIAAAATFSNPAGIPYTSNAGVQGILIIDPAKGYFDYGVTAVNVLTVISAAALGSGIAAYATRVWIATNKIVSYTDVNSYNSFAGAGGSFTISDSYLHNAITALVAANGYLYIFGDDSIDTLSNVQVTGGVTSFSRVNITSSIGTSYPLSIQPYYRSLLFASRYGFYSLSGATPQKISDDLDGLFAPATFVGGLVAGQVTIFGNLCMAWTLRIVDTFTTLYGTGVTRTLLMIHFKQRWFVVYPGFDLTTIASITGSLNTLYGYTTGSAPALYQLFALNGSATKAFLKTKLWDGGSPILDKEVLRVGLAEQLGASVNRNVLMTSDNEYAASSAAAINNNLVTGSLQFQNNLGQNLQFQNNSGGNLIFTVGPGVYIFLESAAMTQGGKYFGLSFTAQQTDLTLLMLAAEWRATRMW